MDAMQMEMRANDVAANRICTSAATATAKRPSDTLSHYQVRLESVQIHKFIRLVQYAYIY